jgi:hypothetical protein
MLLKSLHMMGTENVMYSWEMICWGSIRWILWGLWHAFDGFCDGSFSLSLLLRMVWYGICTIMALVLFCEDIMRHPSILYPFRRAFREMKFNMVLVRPFSPLIFVAHRTAETSLSAKSRRTDDVERTTSILGSLWRPRWTICNKPPIRVNAAKFFALLPRFLLCWGLDRYAGWVPTQF